MPEYSAGQVKLVREVLAWFEEAPSDQEIDTYVANVLKRDATALAALEEIATDTQFRVKRKYFKEIGAESFVSKLNEADQIRYLSAFTSFNPASVSKKIVQLHQVTLPELPPTITEWSREYVGVWEGVLTVISYEDFHRCVQYLRSFMKIPATPEQLVAIRDGSAKSLHMLRSRFFRDIEPTQEELNEERTALALVPFFPEQFIENELRAADDPGKRQLFGDMHKVSDLLINLNGQGDPELVLKELMKAERERDLIAELESQRRSVYPDQDIFAKYFEALDQIVTPENIEHQALMQNLRVAATGFTNATEFTSAIYSYLRKSPLIAEFLLPYDIDFIIAEISQLTTEAEIPTFLSIEGIGVKTEERKRYFMPFLRDLFNITHTYKEQ